MLILYGSAEQPLSWLSWARMLLVRLRRWHRGVRRLGLIHKDGLPVDEGVPQQTLVAAVHVAMHGVEVETDDVSFAHGHIQDGRTADQIFFSPCLAALDERFAVRVAPFHHYPAAVFGTIEASRAIGHAQPAARNVI